MAQPLNLKNSSSHPHTSEVAKRPIATMHEQLLTDESCRNIKDGIGAFVGRKAFSGCEFHNVEFGTDGNKGLQHILSGIIKRGVDNTSLSITKDSIWLVHPDSYKALNELIGSNKLSELTLTNMQVDRELFKSTIGCIKSNRSLTELKLGFTSSNQEQLSEALFYSLQEHPTIKHLTISSLILAYNHGMPHRGAFEFLTKLLLTNSLESLTLDWNEGIGDEHFEKFSGLISRAQGLNTKICINFIASDNQETHPEVFKFGQNTTINVYGSDEYFDELNIEKRLKIDKNSTFSDDVLDRITDDDLLYNESDDESSQIMGDGDLSYYSDSSDDESSPDVDDKDLSDDKSDPVASDGDPFDNKHEVLKDGDDLSGAVSDPAVGDGGLSDDKHDPAANDGDLSDNKPDPVVVENDPSGAVSDPVVGDKGPSDDKPSPALGDKEGHPSDDKSDQGVKDDDLSDAESGQVVGGDDDLSDDGHRQDGKDSTPDDVHGLIVDGGDLSDDKPGQDIKDNDTLPDDMPDEKMSDQIKEKGIDNSNLLVSKPVQVADDMLLESPQDGDVDLTSSQQLSGEESQQQVAGEESWVDNCIVS